MIANSGSTLDSEMRIPLCQNLDLADIFIARIASLASQDQAQILSSRTLSPATKSHSPSGGFDRNT